MKTFDFNPICPEENQIQGASYRISVLTDSLLRLEYEKDGRFTDNATQVVLNRDFPVVLAIVVFITILVTGLNFLADILYHKLDARIDVR